MGESAFRRRLLGRWWAYVASGHGGTDPVGSHSAIGYSSSLLFFLMLTRWLGSKGNRPVLLRFGFWGSISTAIGTSLMMALQAATNRPFLANTIGFVAGGVIGYCIHARKTFNVSPSKRGLGKYLLGVGSGYGLNLLTLAVLIRYVNPYLAQLSAIAAYVCYIYFYSSRVVFNR